MAREPNPQPSGGQRGPVAPLDPNAPAQPAGPASGSARDMDIGSIFDMWAEEEEAPRPFGVPEGYQPPTNLDEAFAHRPAGSPASVPDWAHAPARRGPAGGYVEGDEWFPTSMSREDVIALQNRLRAAGLLVPPYKKGVYDPATREAYISLLGHANTIGEDWATALDHVQRAETVQDPQRMPRFRAFRAPAYREPSAASIATDLRQIWEQRLGREITPEEEEEFASAFRRFHKEAFDVEAGVARAEFEAGQAEDIRDVADQVGIDPMALTPAVAADAPEANAAAPETDFAAQFEQFFNERMRPEIRGQEAARDVGESQQLVSTTLSRISNMMRGG